MLGKGREGSATPTPIAGRAKLSGRKAQPRDVAARDAGAGRDGRFAGGAPTPEPSSALFTVSWMRYILTIISDYLTLDITCRSM